MEILLVELLPYFQDHFKPEPQKDFWEKQPLWMNTMLNKKEFESIAQDLKKFEAEREKAIDLSRRAIHLSKRIIYCLHRNEKEEAGSLLKEIKRMIDHLPVNSYDTTITLTAIQEYVEAATYFAFETGKTIPTRKELQVRTEEYLLGLCDLSGELVRKAVNAVIHQDYDEVQRITQFTEELYAEFLKFNLRNGELRKKYDSIRWNLAKVEDILLALKTKSAP